MPADPAVVDTDCCVVGGGPAGMMAGLLLARAGVRVVVLEKHRDFLRDFRGDTVHPSTMQALADLGLLDDFLKLPHTEVRALSGQVGDEVIHLADFNGLKTAAPFVALMPQWDFLDFLADAARRYPAFDLRMNARAEGLIERDGRVAGVGVSTPDGPLEVRARLVIAADGRRSLLRDAAGLPVEDLGAPMDVLWIRLSRRPADDPEAPLGRASAGRMFVTIPREGYYQCGYVAAKGAFEAIKAAGMEAFRRDVAMAAPMLADRVEELASFEDVHLLTVTVDRLTRWSKPGLLCIGDAAHAMSPVGGVGINLAVQDAVAAANMLHDAFALDDAALDERALAVQRRRLPPTKAMQSLQVLIQNRLIGAALSGRPLKAPAVMKLFERFPRLRRIPARVLGLGFRLERVRSPDAFSG
jgi:2-polyprenyl-6-methoxyphenol hydroxylase-like FAD-dependent oxidoreductase